MICASPPLAPGTQYVDGVRIERLRVAARIYGTPIMPDLAGALARENADIIHANFPSPYIAFLSSLVSKTLKVPAVLTWHNDLPSVTSLAHILVLAHDNLVLPLYLDQFSFLIATSKIYAEASPILSARAAHVAVIPNGVDSRRFHPDVQSGEIRSRLKLIESKVVLFVGALTRWHRYKGLDVLIEAMNLLKNGVPEIRLLVVGGGELECEYRQLVRELNLDDVVVFAGNVSEDQLPEYYRCSEMLVLPSKDRSEGFGLTILEANAAGKPAIGSNVGGIPSVIRDGFNGLLVPPNNPEALAAAIKRAITDTEMMERMGKNARKFAEQRDWSIVAEQTENLYKRALDER